MYMICIYTYIWRTPDLIEQCMQEEEEQTWAGLAEQVARAEEGVQAREARVAALVAVARTHVRKPFALKKSDPGP